MLKLKNITLFPILAGAVVLVFTVFLWPSAEANAQCGSQASSCKNCHEVQSQDPVNSDSTGWHQSHAFGDFCYLCHAGNSQSMDQAESHTGMVPPLSDVEAGCQSCHPTDLMEKAGVYAAALGVEVGAGGEASAPPDDRSGGGESPPPADEPVAADPPEVVPQTEQLVDYDAQYAETVLGEKPVNWGNIVVIGMIGMVGLGGGAFVYWNERKLRGKPVQLTLRGSDGAQGMATGGTSALDMAQFPAEVVELLPAIARLNPVGLHALERMLENPEEANQLLHSVSRLDPELVRRLRTLDRESKAMLIALSGE